MKRAATILAAALLATAAFSAQALADSSVLLGVTAPGQRLVSETTVPVSASGELVVSFHGDVFSGCVADGLCGYSGTVIVQPGNGLQLAVGRLRGAHGRSYEAFLELGAGPTELLSAAEVRRTAVGKPAGMCADARQSFTSSPISITGGEATVALLQSGGTLLETRCAGPLDGDLAAVSPSATVPLSTLLRGRSTVSLRGTRSFATHGFAGTVSSTITLALGKPQTVSPGSSKPFFPKGIKTQRTRTVTEQLSLEHTSGALSASIQGTASAAICGLLDSCGLSGTLTLTPQPLQSAGELYASGPATRPYRDFLAALGLSRGGNPRGIQVLGDVEWVDGGTAAEDLSQPGACTDSEPLGAAGLTIAPLGGRVATSFSVFSPPRTGCPGPLLGSEPLASGELPRRDLGAHTLALTVRAAGSREDDGYVAELGGSLTVEVRRGALSSRISVQPVG